MAASGKIDDSPYGLPTSQTPCPSRSAPVGSIDSFAPAHSTSRSARPRRGFPARSVVDLRNLLAERFPHSPALAETRLITRLSFLDQTIGGGLPKCAITELISSQISAGSASLIHALLEAAQRDRYFVALIDGRDSFEPSTSGGLGNTRLRNLLWVRCRKALEAVKAADLLLRDGNFPLVILDLVLNPTEELRKIPQTSWYRLQRLVESAPTACLVLTRQGIVSSAQLKIVLESSWSLENFETEAANSACSARTCPTPTFPVTMCIRDGGRRAVDP
jgi:hypothetical protein